MKASAAMTRNVVCIEPDDSLIEAHKIMTEWDVRHLPVLRGGVLVGILSDRDVMLHAEKHIHGGLNVPNVPVSNAMTENPITCGLGADIGHLAAMMVEHKIDSLPVVNDGAVLVGLVTSTDLLQILADKARATAVQSLPFQWKVFSSMRPGMATAYA